MTGGDRVAFACNWMALRPCVGQVVCLRGRRVINKDSPPRWAWPWAWALAENIKASLRQRPCQPMRREEPARNSKNGPEHKISDDTTTMENSGKNQTRDRGGAAGEAKPTEELYKFTKHRLFYRSDQYLSRLFNHKPPKAGKHRRDSAP